MEREILVQQTFYNINKLPTPRVQEVNNFVEFMLQKTDDALITEGLQRLSAIGRTYNFLNDEPELYSSDDLKVKFL